ncbi:MAG: hypothetical protein ABI950_01410 [Solirubrobacteraceae bacterium]
MGAGTYAELLRSRGTTRLATSFLTTGLASTMTPVAFVLFAREATGSFATASLVLAAATVGGLLSAPARGRLVDRYGATRALIWLVIPSPATDLALIVAGRAGAPRAALRTVWSARLTDDTTRQAGYALMTAIARSRSSPARCWPVC